MDNKLVAKDLHSIIEACLRNNPARDSLASANDLQESGVGIIKQQTFRIDVIIQSNRKESAISERERNISYFNLKVDTTRFKLEKPMNPNIKSESGRLTEPLYPQYALENDLTYAGRMIVDVKINLTAHSADGKIIAAKKDVESKDIYIGSLPIMVGTKKCNTYGMSIEDRKYHKGDYWADFGYYIINGVPWVINSIESTAYNKPKIYRNVGFEKELTRLEIISKPGDGYETSSQNFIKLMNNKSLFIIIDRDVYKKLEFPFYLVFRLLGAATDREIINYIIPEALIKPDSHNRQILDDIGTAFLSDYNHFGLYDGKTIKPGTAKYLKDTDDVMEIVFRWYKSNTPKTKLDFTTEETIRKSKNRLAKKFDEYLLPHIGTDGSYETRVKKMKNLGYYILQIYMVYYKRINSTDRDSYADKKIHAAGQAFAKSIKTHYNNQIIKRSVMGLSSALNNNSFFEINVADVYNANITPSNYSTLLTKAISTGKKSTMTVGRGQREVKNHLTSQQLIKKNPLNDISKRRLIVSPNSTSSASKQSSRALEMRRFHPTHINFICCVQTQDGTSVGMNKPMAITTELTIGTNVMVLKEKLLKDVNLIPLLRVDHKTLARRHATVHVNGDWVGCTTNPHELINKYVNLRREMRIDRKTTIHWNPQTHEIMFWTDTGRIVRPILIVYNNGKSKNFKQYIKLTTNHIKMLNEKKLTIDSLVEMKIMEYITPAEQENILIASDLNTLLKNTNNPLKQFTHCDIPLASLGYVAMMIPLFNYNPIGRSILATRQMKQAAGIYCSNWPYRIDKEAFNLYNYEAPLVRTIGNKFVHPCGQNVVLAVMMYSGYNQEDSVFINRESTQRGLFNGIGFTFEKAILGKAETFSNPYADTEGMKEYANYSKITDGFPKIGDIINKGDVVIGKIFTKNDGKTVDKSIIYEHSEPAVVLDIVGVIKTADGKISHQSDYSSSQFVKVKLASFRPTVVGDKMAMRSGQKGICGNLMRECDMPFTESGIVPDIVFNPFSYPSRMTVSSPSYEVLIAKVCSLKGCTFDASAGNHFDVNIMRRELKKLGFNSNGTERLYNGITGHPINTEIFIGPVYYQRLLKFVAEKCRASARSSSDVKTRQPVSGKHGGLRIGEMEKDTLLVKGLGRTIQEKLFDHSDAFEVYYCARCGNEAIVSPGNLYECRKCENKASIAKVKTCYAAKLFKHEVEAAGIKMRLHLEKPRYI